VHCLQGVVHSCCSV